MTIEIKQLIIRAVVEDRRERTPVTASHDRAGLGPSRSARPVAATRGDSEALIAECTRRVLRELRRGRGR